MPLFLAFRAVAFREVSRASSRHFFPGSPNAVVYCAVLTVVCMCQMFPDDPVTPIEKRAPSTNPIGKFFEGLLSPVNTAGMKGPEIEPPPPPPSQ